MKTPDKKRILVMRFSAMGDVALTVPVIKSFRRAYPEVEVHLLTRPAYHPFFDGMNLTLPPLSLKDKHRGIPGLYRLYKELTSEYAYDNIIDLHDVLRTKVLRTFFRSSGTGVQSIDKGRREKKQYLSQPVDEYLIHTTERYRRVFVRAGYEFTLNKELLTPDKAELPAQWLENGKIRIGIAPYAAHKSKQWDIKNVYRLIELFRETDAPVVFYLFGGGNREIQELDALANTYKGVINVAGKADLRTELNLISRLDIMLTMDSANAHLAALSGIPVITLWGGTHPGAGFAPLYQDRSHCILPETEVMKDCRLSVYGSDQRQRKQAPYFCINTVEPARVRDVMMRVLQKNQTGTDAE